MMQASQFNMSMTDELLKAFAAKQCPNPTLSTYAMVSWPFLFGMFSVLPTSQFLGRYMTSFSPITALLRRRSSPLYETFTIEVGMIVFGDKCPKYTDWERMFLEDHRQEGMFYLLEGKSHVSG